MYNQNKIEGIEISTNNKSKRIVDLYLKDEFIEKLIFPFKRFDIMALEYKPFTRFTLAKNLDDLTRNKLKKLINTILKDRNTGCFLLKINKPPLIHEFLICLFSENLFTKFLDNCSSPNRTGGCTAVTVAIFLFL